jgi:hypothetical protein
MRKILLAVVVLFFAASTSIGYCKDKNKKDKAPVLNPTEAIEAPINNNIEMQSEGLTLGHEEAIEIAEKALKEKGKDLSLYYYKSIDPVGQSWFITYDLKEKLNQKGRGAPVKAGGEIFVEVDRKTGDAAITLGE